VDTIVFIVGVFVTALAACGVAMVILAVDRGDRARSGGR
jgi:hypothetical protein